MKTLPKRVLLIITILFILTSCEKEKLNSQREEIGSKIEFNRKEITFLEFQEKINSKDKILKKILKNRDSKLIDSLDFVTGIDESSIVEIQRNGITTYTARVYTKTDSINEFTNLLVKNSGNETEIHFFRYFPSKDYQMAMLNSITQPFEGVIQSLDKDGYVKDEIVVIEGET